MGTSAVANDRDILEREIRRQSSQLADERRSREAARANLLQGETRVSHSEEVSFGHSMGGPHEDSEDELAGPSAAYYGHVVDDEWGN